MRASRICAGMLVLSLLVGGCFGPFNLTRRLYNWNAGVDEKWEREIIFLVLIWAPVYSLVGLGDMLVFNSIEFWTGENPVDPPGAALPRTKRLVRGDDEVLLTYTPSEQAGQLLIEQFHSGNPAGVLRIERKDGVTVGSNEQGEVLLMAKALPDGGMQILDKTGEPIKTYSAEHVEEFISSAEQVAETAN